MKIKCQTKELINGLNIVSKTAAGKTTMPILEGVLIEAYNSQIKLTTYDLEMGCTHVIKCNIEEEGATVVDIKMLNEIMRRLEADEVSLEADDNIFTIKSINGVFKLAVMNPQDFPKLPVFTIESQIEIKQAIFRDMVRKVLFAVSTDENRPTYTGALLKVENNILTLVALDGFRLAIKKYMNETAVNDFKAIIPGKVLNEILKILTGNEDETIKIGKNSNQALFEVGSSVIISRIIDGEFLNYNSIIPSDKETRVKVKTKSLLDAFERVALFSKESTDRDKKSPVKAKITLDGINLSCTSQTGDAKEDIMAEVEGKELEIGFNPRYFIETLKVIEDEEIIIDFTSNIAPAVIHPLETNEYIYIVLPLKLRQE